MILLLLKMKLITMILMAKTTSVKDDYGEDNKCRPVPANLAAFLVLDKPQTSLTGINDPRVSYILSMCKR